MSPLGTPQYIEQIKFFGAYILVRKNRQTVVFLKKLRRMLEVDTCHGKKKAKKRDLGCVGIGTTTVS